MIEKLAKINVNGTEYFGVYSEKEITFACEVCENTIETWIKRQNAGTLITISLASQSTVVVEPLTAKEQRKLKLLWKDMQLIKEQALWQLQNYYFVNGLPDA
ncbi:hypothetical protein LCGC14_2346450 [marine sediment metagenome]|uniref:Uncharacterized protein n=1 Tax=marine sediment metagenome TaxID=412755 RepID=A0A0F9CY16_9ZZZZ